MICLPVFASQASAQVGPMPNIAAQILPGLAAGQQAQPFQQTSPLSMEICQKLPPSQRATCEEELRRTGGRLSPEALEAIKTRPEYKGLSPDEVAQGMQLLEQKERAGVKKGSGKLPLTNLERERTTVEEPRGESLFDRTRKIGKYQDISVDLKPFGYDFFIDASIRILTDRKDIPVPQKYVIGAGDEVKLLLWGRVNAQYNLTVDRDGKITIPQIGPLFVAGMTFDDMSKKIIKQSEQIVGTNVDISMGSLKTIPVFILGDIRRPGSYTIGSFATITDALLLAGGPTEIGSMRHVQLKRKGQLITTFDLYDLLLKGDKSKDMTLMAGDVVFVPVTGPMVGIAGNVKRPAIYELRNRYDLEEVINLAGGIIPTAYTQQIQVERIVKNERHVIFDINDKKLEKAAGVKLQDADLIKIFSIVDMNVNVVYLNGNVKRPGKYEIKEGMRLGDLIKDTTELLPETYFEYALIKRLNPPAMETVLIPFSLTNLLKKDPASNLELKPRDQVYVFSRWFFKDRPLVMIEGEIRGECNIEEGGRKKQGQPGSAEIDAIGQELKVMELDLKKDGLFDLASLTREIADDIRLRGRISSDGVRILRDELIKAGQIPVVARLKEIENRTKISCEIPLIDNMRVKDLILIAGGLTNDSYREKGEIIRTSRERAYETLYFSVSGAMMGDPAHNLALQDEDRIVIHSIWEQVYKKNVTIDGDVAKPGNYQYTEGMTVRDLVFKGGNILESAYVDEAEVSSIVIELGRKTSKTERKVINLKMALEGDSVNNLVLLPYDRLFVKKIPDWSALKIVTVTGEFRFPGRYTVHKGEKLSSLIERAGGYTANAYLRGAVFTRQSVREIQQQGLEEMARRMEKDLIVQGSAAISAALSAEEIRGKEVEMTQKQKFIETLKSLKAQGRMTIRLASIRQLKGGEYDIELEEGDRLHIPQKNNVVNVMGSVMAQASYIYLDRLSYQDYIRMAGGYARYADESSTFVLKVDGSARKLDRGFMGWIDSQPRWEKTAFGEHVREIEPGDVIVVPEKFDRIAWLREIRDITQILMNTAVVAATLIHIW
jgi:protein involved in polysaccharide export with SLBB domain